MYNIKRFYLMEVFDTVEIHQNGIIISIKQCSAKSIALRK